MWQLLTVLSAFTFYRLVFYLRIPVSVYNCGLTVVVLLRHLTSCHPSSTIRIFLITNYQPLFHICITLPVESAPFFIPSTSFCSQSSWFTSSCAYHLITVTTFAFHSRLKTHLFHKSFPLQQDKRVYSMLVVHGKFQNTRSNSHFVKYSVPINGQQSVDAWKLDAAATDECCRSNVRALFCCSHCLLMTPPYTLAAKVSWTIGGAVPRGLHLKRPWWDSRFDPA